ncbi:MAG: single-stranded DNA-binding protein [Actinomycetota bacterium]|nr:single-stranded DNA-binding protein [Actinomycetota bacterium]
MSDDSLTELTAVPEQAAPQPADGPEATQLQRLEVEGDVAADFLEELLDIVDLDGDIDLDVEGDRATVSVVGSAGLSALVGERGAVLDALQELARLAVLQETGERSRLMLDVAGHRARRRVEIEQLATEAAASVRSTGEPQPLAAMNPFERKVVHDAVASAGLTSESEGEEPQRRVVVLPPAPAEPSGEPRGTPAE